MRQRTLQKPIECYLPDMAFPGEPQFLAFPIICSVRYTEGSQLPRSLRSSISARRLQNTTDNHLLTSITRSKQTLDTLRLEHSLPVQY
jgi:hypothetical protein